MAHQADQHHRHGRRRQAARGRGLALERLEDRRVLSANAYIYGIADNNTIWEVDVAAKTSRAVFDAQPVIGTGNSNAFAYDNSRSQFFFIDPQNQLRFWDRGSTLTVLATHDALGLAATGNQPCNAAYYNDAYWYFTDGTNVLNKVSFTYTDGVPAMSGRETFAVNDAPTLTNTFGDIAIDANTGILYASNTNGAFYKVNLAAPQSGYTLIKPAVDESPGLQLSFDTDYSVLYGQSFTGGQWYTVNRSTGENTPILGFATLVKGINGLRDIGGSADTPVVEADLSITKTDGSDAYVPGRAVTYTITVTNNGPVAVTGARVRDALPTGTTFVSATGGATYDGVTNTVRYTAGRLAAGGSASFTMTILPAATRTGTLVNTATVTSPPGVIDTNPTNNSASDTDARLSPVDLSIAKTDGATTYAPGRAVTYTITVSNAGPSAVTGATVADVLPAGTTFVSASDGATYNAARNTVSYRTGTVGVGGTASFTITILPAATRTGALVNTATVTAPARAFELNAANNSATDTDTAAPVADLSITKTDGAASYVPGRAVTYTITVSNAGPSAVSGATVADVLPAGTTFLSATGGATYDAGTKTVRYTAGALSVGGTASFTMTILPASGRTGDLVNTATVAPPSGTTDPTSGNNTATDTDTPAPIADLSITKTDGSANYTPGRAVTYTITVGNAGPSAVTGATVSDVLPAGTTFVSATGGATYNAGTNTVSYTTGTIGVGGTTSFTLTILPAATRTGALVNTATVAPPSGTTDPTSANNTDTDIDAPAPLADLSIAKTDGRAVYAAGRNTTYTITVSNAGPSAVTGAIVSDVLPAGTTFVSASGGATYDADTNTVSYTTGTLGMGGTTSFTLTILPAATRTGELANTATVAPPSGTVDPTSENNTATDIDSDAPDAVILAVSDVGCESTPTVTVIDAATGSVRTQFQAFENGFRGGIRAALGDLDGDGVDEIVAGAGPGRSGEIRVFTLEGVERTGFRLMPFGAGCRDGIEVAVGDVNGDGYDDVVAARSRGAGEVAILQSTGSTIRQAAAFTAFSPSVVGGAVVAVADMGTFVGGTDRGRLDGRAEVIVGSGTGVAPTVMIYDASGTPRVVDSFRPLSAAYQAGFSIAAQRINADQIPDLLVAGGRSAATTVEVYDGVSKAKVATYQAFASVAKGSARAYAAAADIDGDGYADEVYMTQGTGGTAAGVQRLRVQAPNAANSIATSVVGPLRIVTRGPRRLAA